MTAKIFLIALIILLLRLATGKILLKCVKPSTNKKYQCLYGTYMYFYASVSLSF